MKRWTRPALLGRKLPWSLLIGIVLIVFFLVAGFVGPRLVKGDPLAMDTTALLLPPSLAHPFGTDNFGRDILVRVLHAAPVDLQMGLFMMLPGLLIGTIVGCFMGYRGGLLDAFMMRFIDVLVAFPLLIVQLAFIAFVGPGFSTMYLAAAIFSWMGYARLIRGQMLVERQLDYVSAAYVLGYSHRRILVVHILPNIFAQSLVFASAGFVEGILVGSGLSFLGFGVQPPTPEWGVMIGDGRLFLLQAPWMTALPGLTIVAVAAAFTLFGDGLADFLRPETEQ
jgi:peptide/nickel transport system permease protein